MRQGNDTENVPGQSGNKQPKFARRYGPELVEQASARNVERWRQTPTCAGRGFTSVRQPPAAS